MNHKCSFQKVFLLSRPLPPFKTPLPLLVAARVPSGMHVQHIVRQGTVYEMVLLTAKEIDADLIIIASHRPELKDYLLGPNAARVVRHANCSVLVVR